MTTINTTVNTARLLDLGRWLTKEERARRRGEPSHWNQGVWVQTDTDDVNELPIDVMGKPGGEQPVLINWSCGTAACAAGHISLEDGGSPAFSTGAGIQPLPPAFVWDANDPYDWLESLSSSYMYFGGNLETIEDHARRVLGLDQGEAGRLFDGDNDWDQMVYVISDLTGIPEGQLELLIGAEDMPANPDEDDNSGW